ncbi:catalase family peroxidase [Noviherbaspirillum autotrophicum]|uniref:Catalase-related peroxidase n=1 Tax=Noviherbaspirillum autotrophicum TaxID=709839 RepID=A0A0C1YR68_9BURK|nr:catalase family peroxidase [Noviherbaspirillum autotrophicum]KIF83112.1 protein SrpA [Noviherbaspirillum autotrophicum]
MHSKNTILVAAIVSLGQGASLAAFADAPVSASQVVQALEDTFGVHPGQRRNHVKGTCALGEFIGNPEIARYSRSALFTGKPVPVVARFSVAGGNPNAPDTAKSARGMALEFQLPQGHLQHMTMINTPVFGAASPKTFFDLTVATRPDPKTGKPDPEKIKAFKASHPDNSEQAKFLETHNPPMSYANSAYFGIHTFKFISQDNKTTLVRWQFVPQDGEKRLSDEELKSAAPNFLEPALIRRTQRGPVRWDMVVTIGEPGDSEDNPTLAWPQERRQIKAGVLTISAAMSQKGAKCEPINYDPLVMSDGIAPTNDPILLFRSPSYAVSAGKRLSGQ